MKMKKVAALVLALLTFASLTACSGSTSTSADVPQTTVAITTEAITETTTQSVEDQINDAWNDYKDSVLESCSEAEEGNTTFSTIACQYIEEYWPVYRTGDKDSDEYAEAFSGLSVAFAYLMNVYASGTVGYSIGDDGWRMLEASFKSDDSTAEYYASLVASEYKDNIGVDLEGIPDTSKATLGEQNALKQAKNYINLMPFSYTGLIGQLEYEGYTTEEATYGADNCGADWYEQAAKKAQDYLDIMSFSREGLIDQLLYEGFTQEEAEYGVTAVGY